MIWLHFSYLVCKCVRYGIFYKAKILLRLSIYFIEIGFQIVGFDLNFILKCNYLIQSIFSLVMYVIVPLSIRPDAL
jgi:hypothetical protein